MFKVVPDQLRVSEGWVRCGQCDEVFDANAHLQGEGQPVTQPLPESPPPAVPEEPASSTVVVTEPEPEPEPEVGTSLEQQIAEKLEWPQSQPANLDPLANDGQESAFRSEPQIHLDLPGASDLPPDESVAPADEPSWDVGALVPARDVDVPVTEILVPPTPMPTTKVGMFDDLASDEAPELPIPPAFMRKVDGKPQRWQKPWVQRSLVGLAVVLFLGLLLHGVVRERDRIAAHVPETLPALTSMCSVLGCKVAPLLQIDAVVIDSSAFVKVRGDVYRLNVTIKNVAALEIAAPAIELTLTDLLDQPLIRRVVTAQELGAVNGTLPANGELTAALPIHVNMSGSVERVSGYRLLAFYP